MVAGRCQFHAGLFLLARLRIQGPKAMVAMGLERVHAEGFGAGKGLAVVGFGQLTLWRIGPCHNLAGEVQGIRLIYIRESSLPAEDVDKIPNHTLRYC